MKLKDLLKENWDVKNGKILSNGKLVGYYEFDRNSDSFWVDDVKKGKGQLSFDTKKEVEDYFKKNEKDALKHLAKLRESISEATMHAMTRESAESMKKELMKQLQWVTNQIKKARNDNEVRRYTKIKKDTLSKLDQIKKTGRLEGVVSEDGFPGGAGVGLSLPGGYINGAPSYDKVKSTKKRIQNDTNQRYTKVEQK